MAFFYFHPSKTQIPLPLSLSTIVSALSLTLTLRVNHDDSTSTLSIANSDSFIYAFQQTPTLILTQMLRSASGRLHGLQLETVGATEAYVSVICILRTTFSLDMSLMG